MDPYDISNNSLLNGNTNSQIHFMRKFAEMFTNKRFVRNIIMIYIVMSFIVGFWWKYYVTR